MTSPNTPEYCQYSYVHLATRVPATTILDCGPRTGHVPACAKCAAFYRKLHQS